MSVNIPVDLEIQKLLPVWKRIRALYENDEAGINGYCWQFPTEDDVTYNLRRERYAQIAQNPTQDLVTTAVDAVWAQSHRYEYDGDATPNKDLITWTENVTAGDTNKVSLEDYARQFITPEFRTYATSITVIDKPKGTPVHKGDEDDNFTPFLSKINPWDVLHVEQNGGDITWIAYSASKCPPWVDYTKERPAVENITIIIDKTSYAVYDADGGEIDKVSHGAGVTPVVIEAAYPTSTAQIWGRCAMFTSQNMIFTAFDFLSAGAFEAFKYASAELLIPDSAVRAENVETDSEGNVKKKSTQIRGWVYDSEEGPPSYLTKDLEMKTFDDKAQEYLGKAYENEKNQTGLTASNGNPTGTDAAQSGIAKLIDRDPIVGNLSSLAVNTENAVDKILDIVARFYQSGDNVPNFVFDKDFDIRTAKQKWEEFKLAQETGLRELSITAYRMKVHDAIGDVPNEEKRKEIKEEIDKIQTEADINKGDRERILNGFDTGDDT